MRWCGPGHSGHTRPQEPRQSRPLSPGQADSVSGPATGVTIRSGGTSPESASTSSALLLLGVEAQLRRWSEQHGHHAVVAGQPADQAGVAVDAHAHRSLSVHPRQRDAGSLAAGTDRTWSTPAGHPGWSLLRGAAGRSALARSTTSMASARPHQRQVIDSTHLPDAPRTSSTSCSPARSKCQYSSVPAGAGDVEAGEVAAPAAAQRWCGSGRRDGHEAPRVGSGLQNRVQPIGRVVPGFCRRAFLPSEP